MAEKETDGGIDSKSSTGQLFMLSKKERILVKTVLIRSLESHSGRQFVIDKLGAEYITIGQKLIKDIG